MRLLSFCMFGILCGASAFAASPTVGLVLPRGGQRGTDVTLTFQGSNLADAQEILVYYPGISVKKIDNVKPNEVKATVAIAADCRLGEHAFRVRTATGLSDLRTFWVGALPIVESKKPNGSFDTAQPIPLNVTVHGSIPNEGTDYFVVECKKGQRLSVEIEAMRLGTTFFDPTVTVYNEKQFELAVADDSFITGQDGGASIVVPADGKYFVQVRESSFGAGSYYRLHVGNFPRPTAIVPAGGKPGETVEFRFLGDPLGEIRQSIKLPTSDLELTRLHAQNADGIHPAGIKVRVNGLTPIVETTNANSLKTAMTGTAPCAFNGVISAAGETDYMKFAAKKGQPFRVECFGRRLGSPIDPVIHVDLLGKDGKVARSITAADDVGGPDPFVQFAAPEDGEYSIWVHDHLMQGGPTHFYRVEVHAPQPTAGVRLPKVDGNNASNQERQTWCVPKGGRLAMPLLLRRSDWGGAATLALDDLPPGIRATVEEIDFSNSIVPVILEAKADAAIGAKLTMVRLVPKQGEIQSTERSTVEVAFALGNNNTIYHSLPTDRIAVAVTDASPFGIEAVEPKVPLVQNGSMKLKVVAKREKGFTGPITVLPVLTPPGLGVAGSTVIPENASECMIDVNAAGNAPVRKWRLAFMAVGNAGGGNVWVGSQLITLEVAPPFVTFAQQRTAVEQGQSTQVICKITANTPFTGKARATLVGLPPKVTAAPVEFENGSAEIAFNVATDKTSPAGKHNTFCQVTIVKDGETIFHNLGGAELRIDVPLAPKTSAAALPPPPKATATPPKPLSRLEQLRKEQEEREKSEAKSTQKPESKKP